MRHRGGRGLSALAAVLILIPGRAGAQPLGQLLASLLTAEAATLPNGTQDLAAAQQTFQAVAGLLGVELTNLPVPSASGGFVYRLNPGLGAVERASESFGPFFTERALRIGARQIAVGLTYQAASFTTLQGADLSAGTFPTNAVRVAGVPVPYNVDTLRLDLDARSVTAQARYGVSDALEVGVQAPFVSVHFAGVRVNSTEGQMRFRTAASGTATGLGDLTVTARYRLRETRASGVALGSDVTMPTGREEDLLGSGRMAVRTLIIGSYESGPWTAHANGGLGAGGASSELFWGGAVTFTPLSRLTIVGEFFARRLQDLHELTDVYQPHPLLRDVETMRWVATEGGVTTSYAVSGVKWNVGGSMVLNANLLLRLSDAGLRARVTPSISMDYLFQGLAVSR